MREEPHRLIFIDAQQDMYGDALTADYLTIELTAPGWESLLTHYGIDWVIEVPGTPLAAALRARPDAWQALYVDGTAAVFARR